MLEVVPVTFRQAIAFVADLHRHHKPPRGMKFAIGAKNGTLRGVAVVGRPSARAEDTGLTAEVTRTCTDGTMNANSLLYGACRKIAKAMGYTRLITYTQEGESGVSLRAAGWIMEAELDPRGNWAESSQKLRHLRDDTVKSQVKRYRWRAW